MPIAATSSASPAKSPTSVSAKRRGARVMNLRDNARDTEERRPVETDAAADRILIRKVAAHKTFTDRHDLRRAGQIRRSRVSSRSQRNPHGAKIAGRDCVQGGAVGGNSPASASPPRNTEPRL